MSDDNNVKVSHPDLNKIKKVIIYPNFSNTIQVLINDYLFDINYSYNQVRVTKKHKDLKIYPDLNQISEIISNYNVKDIIIYDNSLNFIFDNNNQIERKLILKKI